MADMCWLGVCVADMCWLGVCVADMYWLGVCVGMKSVGKVLVV